MRDCWRGSPSRVWPVEQFSLAERVDGDAQPRGGAGSSWPGAQGLHWLGGALPRSSPQTQELCTDSGLQFRPFVAPRYRIQIKEETMET